jgi:hypothetical protein
MLRESFKDPSFAREHAVPINGNRYHAVRADELSIYAKEVQDLNALIYFPLMSPWIERV